MQAKPSSHHHCTDSHTASLDLVQASLRAIETQNADLALVYAEQAVVAGEQHRCMTCLRSATLYLATVQMQRGDYTGAHSAYMRAEQLAQQSTHSGCEEMIATSRDLCNLLQQSILTSRRLHIFQAEIDRYCQDVDAGIRNALSVLARYQGASTPVQRLVNDEAAVAAGPNVGTAPRRIDLDIQCLGLFAVYHAGQRIIFPRNRKAEGLLKYLVLHRDRPVSRDVLMHLGWPDASRQAAINDLNTTVSLLRGSLTQALDHKVAGTPIVFEDGHYCLNPALVLRLDVAEFDAAVDSGLAYERLGHTEAAIRAYETAAALYRGHLLMGDLYDDWTIIERERLATRFLTLLSKLGGYGLQQAQYEDAIMYAHRLLEQEPCCEDAHRLLMVAYARQGQRVQALRQYELCKGLLRRELDIEPSAETTILREHISGDERV